MKELITWSDHYNLGIAEIDAQHQKMIGIINKLYQTMQASTEKEDLREVLAELVDYADYHFITEEKYFEMFNYADKVEHTKSHDAYREKINGFVAEYNKGAPMLSFKMMEYLGEWWTGHILGADRKYVECFHKHGLK